VTLGIFRAAAFFVASLCFAGRGGGGRRGTSTQRGQWRGTTVPLLYAALLSSAGVPVCAAQRPEAVYQFDIPAGPLSQALYAFSLTASVQMIFSDSLVHGRLAPTLHGLYTREQALQLLLQGSGLIAQRDGTDVVMIKESPPPELLAWRALATPAAAAASAAPAPAAEPAAVATIGQLQEVQVTATRFVQNLDDVPLSITAETQRTLDTRSITNIADVASAVPSVALTNYSNGPGLANIAIRGVSDAGLGAPTTGFYLDDTPLQKRNVGGAFSSNGTPLPPIFDLDRVEVLRGPQGTLFGGSSEGGTIRYITPTPSLSKDSFYGKAQFSTTQWGAPSYKAGFAGGGPLIDGTLAVRGSVYGEWDGGWLDYVDRISGRTTYTNANDEDVREEHAKLLWVPNPRFSATLALFDSDVRSGDRYNSYGLPIGNAIVAHPVCNDTTGITAQHYNNNPRAVACPAGAVAGQIVNGIYERPGYTYGPYPDLQPDQTLTQQALMPSDTTLQVPSLTLEFDLPFMSIKSITSGEFDNTNLVSTDGPNSQIRDAPQYITFGSHVITRQFTSYAQLPFADYRDGITFTNVNRHGFIQELRFTSNPASARRFAWVAGLYYSNFNSSERYDNTYPDLNQIAEALYGIDELQRYGTAAPLYHGVADFDAERQWLHEVDAAVYGEVDFRATRRLTLTAGVRPDRDRLDYREEHFGSTDGFEVPTLANGGGPNLGSLTEGSVALHFEAQYQLARNRMVYVSAAQGFRPGGVNTHLPPSICAPGFGQYGLSSAAEPANYRGDSVWSYEAGGKFGLWGGRVQLNGALYRLDWKDPQLSVTVGLACPAFVSNAGYARSEGLEFEGAANLLHGLTANFALGYDDARYTENAIALPGGTPVLYAAYAGQHIAVPPLTATIGAQFSVAVSAHSSAYARLDWQYARHYSNTISQVYSFDNQANPNYAPDNIYPDTQATNLRIGWEHGGYNLNLFVLNLFNTMKGVVTGLRSNCAPPSAGGTAACTSFATANEFVSVTPAYPPRRIGLQLIYRK
jgi:outer membrane receptor protein involved in Fe transport